MTPQALATEHSEHTPASPQSGPAAPVQPQPKIQVDTPAGRIANILSFTLGALSSLAQVWTLVSLGRGLGSLAPTLSSAPTSVLASLPLPATFNSYLLQAAFAALLAAACQVAVELVSRSSAIREEGQLRRRALAHLLELGPARAAHLRTGSTTSLLTDGAERVSTYRQTFLAPAVASVLTPVLVLLLLAVTVDLLSALILFAGIVTVPAAIGFFLKHSRRSSAGSRRERMRLAGAYLDAIQGLTTLTLIRAAERAATDLRHAGEANRQAIMRMLAGNQRIIFLTDSLFSLFFIAATAVLALVRLSSGAIDLGGALALSLSSFVLLEPLDRLGAFFYVGMGGVANQRAICRILATRRPGAAAPVDDAVGNRENSSSTANANEQVIDYSADSGAAGVDESTAPRPAAAPAAPAFSMSGVTAAWEPERPVLTGVNLQVTQGERIALTGPSGAGKSTLLSLATGDLLPAAGTVQVGGVTLNAANQDAIRAASAVVSQSTWLFCGTIADNLRLADPQATTAQMWQALQEANLAQEVRQMPDGLDTLVGEQGLGLSGGQAQRVSLARAFLANRPLLLLDEPTSQVDLAGEALILQAIERLAVGRTVLTVSHRQGAVDAADRVLQVADGHVQEVA
ncbi:Probable ABC transporter ATP-binding protein HI_0664 [Actinomyces bovis]|uniref:Probable ABC transporter ATP-binding protein HI_0664 n=2 Tax=Actinomyces bovis TaxID=1658 RepID=A0ABY1VNQ2_9ACTO|nr:Probable ABC transporter ATP-binding protein HI_0664 [Actinomyces bovis]VEG55631.1 Probable ABC transporter ATP-binding protein HI_0664 [Actinomyces israelii]